MSHTANILDKDSYLWLQDKYPDLAEAIEADTRAGVKPEELKRLVMRQRDNRKLALLCEAAARHIWAQGVGEVSTLEKYGLKE